jgi:hypothetical protein
MPRLSWSRTYWTVLGGWNATCAGSTVWAPSGLRIARLAAPRRRVRRVVIE